MSDPQPKPRLRRKRRRKPRTFWQWMFLLAAASIVIGGAVSTAVVLAMVRLLPPVEELVNYNPAEATTIFDRTGTIQIGDMCDENRIVTGIEEMPLDLRHAFLAIEDSRYHSHFGVDLIGIVRAAKSNYESGRNAQGASTITMQLARNVLPEDRLGRQKKFERKIKEALIAMKIESQFSKDQILEFYLNTIFLGANSYGVKAAAMTYFSKGLDELTLAECALLGGLPQAPSTYNPIVPRRRKYAIRRRNDVLNKMANQGWINEDEYKQAINEPLTIRRGDRANNLFPYFQDSLERDLRANYGIDTGHLKRSGLKITTTLDAGMQAACENALRAGLPSAEKMWKESKYARHLKEEEGWNGVVHEGETRLFKITAIRPDSVDVKLNDWTGTIPMPEYLPYWEPGMVLEEGAWLDVKVTDVDRRRSSVEGEFADTRPVEGAIVVLDAKTAEVLAIVGGGAPFYDRRLGFYNRALMGGRQVGSGVKPLFFAAALECGMQPNSIVVDEPVQYGNYKPRNYEKYFFGPTTLIEALEHSRNVVTIRLFEAMGIKRTLEYVTRFDFTGATRHWDLRSELASALGACDATPFEMAAAYQVFANLGVGIRPSFFRSIVSRDGRVAIARQWKESAIIEDPIHAAQMQYMLRQVIVDGTGRGPIGSNFPSPPNPPVCGKTGTTNDCRDAWFIGFTPELVIAVQVGFDTPRPMGPRMTGGRVAGPIWAQAFRDILKTRDRWQTKFETPPGVAYADVSADTGKRASSISTMYGEKVYSRAPFARGTEPVTPDNGVILQPVIAPIGAEYGHLAAGASFGGYATVPMETEFESADDFNWFE